MKSKKKEPTVDRHPLARASDLGYRCNGGNVVHKAPTLAELDEAPPRELRRFRSADDGR